MSYASEPTRGSESHATAPITSLHKAAPKLLPQEPAMLRKFGDLLWLTGQVTRTAPGASVIWIMAALTSAGLVPAQLWATKNLVDALEASLTGQVGGSSIILMLVLLSGALLVQNALNSYAPLKQAVLREEASSKLHARVMMKATQVDLAEFEHEEYHNQISRVLEAAEGRPAQIVGRVITILESIPRTLGYAVALFILSPWVLVIVVASWASAIYSHIRAGEKEWSQRKSLTRTRRLSNYYGMFVTYRDFAKEVRLFGLSDYTIGRWRHLFWEARNAERRFEIQNMVRNRMSIFVAQAVSLVGIWWTLSVASGSGGIGSGIAGSVSAGAITLLFQSFSGMANELFKMAGALKGLADDSGYASELRAFLSLPTSQTLPPDESNAAHGQVPFPNPLREGIRFEDVWFTYPGTHVPALAGVSFTIRPGEKLALIGVNGAGKTTLTKLLLGLYQPDRGRITVDGVDITEIDPDSLRKAMSAVFQSFVRYQMTFRENVGLGQPENMNDRARLEESVAKAGASAVLEGLAQGYETVLGPDVGGEDLSGGEWQRVALARGFFRDAQVLVLDEPTAALDPLAELDIFERFIDLASDRTALLISHRLGMARLADRIVVMAGGKVVEEGTHTELIHANGEYAQLFGAQARWYA